MAYFSKPQIFPCYYYVGEDPAYGVRVLWDNAPVSIIAGSWTLHISSATARFQVLAPVRRTPQVVKVMVTNSRASGVQLAFDYTYVGKSPQIFHIEPQTVEAPRSLSNREISIYGRYFELSDTMESVVIELCNITQVLDQDSIHVMAGENVVLFHVSVPPCATLGTSRGTIHNVEFTIEYVVPPVRMLQLYFAVGVPAALRFEMWLDGREKSLFGLDHKDDVQVKCANWTFPISSVSSIDTEVSGVGQWWRVETVRKMLPFGVGDIHCEVSTSMESQAQPFELHFYTIPTVESIIPYPLYTSMDPNGGHEEITLHVKHFPQFVSPSEFDSMRVQLEDGGRSVPLLVLSFVQSGDFATLKALAPTRQQPQRLSGTVTSTLLSYLAPLPFTLEYIKQPPSVLHVHPASGSSHLKVEEASTVEVLLQHFSPVKDTEDVTIVNVDGDVWKVEGIVYSDARGTMLHVKPALSMPGVVKVEIMNFKVAERVYFTFQYNDNRFKVKSPESLCAAELEKDEYSALAHCLVYSPSSPLVVEVVGFPVRIEQANDLFVLIGNIPVDSRNVQVLPQTTETSSLRLNIQLPKLQAEFYDWTSDGEYVSTLSVSLKATPTVGVNIAVVFLDTVRAVSAQFASHYGFVDIVWNQPTNGLSQSSSAVQGTTTTTVSCHPYVETTDLLLLGHSTTSDDSLQLCSWESPHRLRIRFTPFEGMKAWLKPGQTVLTLKAGSLMDDGGHLHTANEKQNLTVALGDDRGH
jgi:hypothetical protein